LRTIKQKLGNGMIATDSCVTAIYFALKYLDRPFKELLAEVLQIGGDVDTIAAMSCAIWGAKNGGEQIVPLASNFENDERIKYLAQSIFAAINPTAK
jgi:poly(ADP-ribose) glycohydrolase ARH3